jgi:hypothetical protein
MTQRASGPCAVLGLVALTRHTLLLVPTVQLKVAPVDDQSIQGGGQRRPSYGNDL